MSAVFFILFWWLYIIKEFLRRYYIGKWIKIIFLVIVLEKKKNLNEEVGVFNLMRSSVFFFILSLN